LGVSGKRDALHLPHFAALEPIRSGGSLFPALQAGQRTMSVVVCSMCHVL
jgi:hypothetical protein